jgi:hypothetical protein
VTSLPPLYARWIDAVLEGPLPSERAATCDDCAMWSHGRGDGATISFARETKCCTYVPALPNFLVGRVMADDRSDLARGRATVEARLDRRVGVTPLGLEAPVTHALLYELGAPHAFGRARSLRCPHYLPERGGCGIWRHRNGTCATWFCKHERGATSMRFWQMLDQLFNTLEREIARWCVLELGLGDGALAQLFPHGTDRRRGTPLDAEAMDGRVNDGAYRTMWGSWSGREREFYRDCATLVEDLDWPEVETIGGPDVRIWSRLVLDAYERVRSTALPPRLRIGEFTVLHLDRRRAVLVGYRGFDPLEIPRPVFDALPHFGPRPTSRALASIEHERGLRLESPFVLKLIDFGILVAAR